jgi:hypothetical protein
MSTLDNSTPAKPQTLYFGYGSNLWLHQMQLRCPTSQYLGVARLPNYRLIAVVDDPAVHCISYTPNIRRHHPNVVRSRMHLGQPKHLTILLNYNTGRPC